MYQYKIMYVCKHVSSNVTMNKVPFTCLLFEATSKKKKKTKHNIRSAKLPTRRVNKIESILNTKMTRIENVTHPALPCVSTFQWGALREG